MSQSLRGAHRGPGRRGGPPPGRGRGSSPSTRGTGSGGGPPAIFAQGRPLKQDSRLADPELNQLVQGFRRLTVKPEMPLRPGWGQLGQLGALRTNFFTVRLQQSATFFEYEITMSPKEQAKGGDRKARIVELVEQAPEFAPYATHVAHDRSQRLVSARKLPQPLEVPVVYLEEGQSENPNPLRFTVEITFREELKMSDLDR